MDILNFDNYDDVLAAIDGHQIATKTTFVKQSSTCQFASDGTFASFQIVTNEMRLVPSPYQYSLHFI